MNSRIGRSFDYVNVERDISVLPTDTLGSDVLINIIPCKVLVENNDLDTDINSVFAAGILAAQKVKQSYDRPGQALWVPGG